MSQDKQELTTYLFQQVLAALHSPAFLLRVFVLLFPSAIILLRTLFSTIKLLEEVFALDSQIIFQCGTFEALMIGLIFLFGVGMMYAAVYNEPLLTWVLGVVGLVLVLMASWVLVMMSNRCILDLECNLSKYGVGLLVTTIFSITGLILPALVQRSFSIFIVPYIGVALYQALLLLTIADVKYNLEPSTGAAQGLVLFLFTVVMILLIRVFSPVRPASRGQPH